MKLTILVSILFDLLSKRKLTAAYLAEKHGISTRTVYRYVALLAEVAPLHVKRGRNGGVCLSDCYKLPVEYMTEAEYEATIEALSLAYAAQAEAKFLTAKRKLSAQSKPQPQKEMFAGTLNTLFLDGDDLHNPASVMQKLRLIEGCIQEKSLAEIALQRDNGKPRIIEPHALLYRQDTWYVCAFCHTERTFCDLRLGEICSVVKLEENFHPRPYQKETEHATTAELIPLRFEVSDGVLPEAQDWLGAENMRRKNGKWIADGTFANDEYLLRKILSFGDGIKVLSPVRLRQLLREKAEATLSLYSRD